MNRGTGVEVDVAFVDFRHLEGRPIDDQSFVEFAAKVDTRFASAIATADGVIHPWNLLLVDTPQGIEAHADFYAKLATSFFDFRIIVIIDVTSEENDLDITSLTIPERVISVRQKLKFIVVSDCRGVQWAAGGMVPNGVVYWDRDPAGNLSINVICEVLRESAVFTAVFDSILARDSDAWAVGTKQVWMGKLSGELTQDVFVEVGKDTIGSGRLASKEMETWPEPMLLVGTAVVPGTLPETGEIARSYSQIDELAVKIEAEFGIRGPVKRQILTRIAESPDRQQSLARLLGDRTTSLLPRITSLVNSIDATNGFDRDELRHLKQEGVDLRAALVTEDSSAQMENEFVEGILNKVQDAIESGHSIERLIQEVSDTSKRVRPRSKTQISFDIEECLKEVTGAVGTIEKSRDANPSGFLYRAGRMVARLLKIDWVRYVLGFLYLWVLVAGVLEVIGVKESGWARLWPSVLKKTGHVSAIAVSILLLVCVALAGAALKHADQKVRQWGRAHHIDTFRATSLHLRDTLALVATNDWASYDVRARVHSQLEALCEVLALVSDDVKVGFIEPFSEIDPDELDSEIPNPQVRQDLNARAQGRAFKYIAEIKEILRIDLAAIINRAMQHTYALRAPAGMSKVPGRVHAELTDDLERYVRDGRHFGLLYEHLSNNIAALKQRRELGQKIWGDPGLVDEAIRSVVLMSSPVEVVTFVGPNHLRLLSTDERDSAEVRFFPTHAVTRLTAISNQLGYSPEIVTTDSMSAAGVIRLTPFKAGVIDFEDSST